AIFAAEPGFPIARAFGRVVRPTLQLAMLARGGAAVHSAAVELDGKAVLVAGWSESGKTETALALVEEGARFLSDKWTFVAEDGIRPGLHPPLRAHGPRANAARARPELDSGHRGESAVPDRPPSGRAGNRASAVSFLDPIGARSPSQFRSSATDGPEPNTISM